MNELNYFAYGSNMHKQRIDLRVGYVERVGTGILFGYRLSFTGGKGGYANIEPGQQSDTVEGVIYRLNHRQIFILDSYEGYPYAYEKIYFTLNNQITFAYISYPLQIKPNTKYLRIVLNGAIQNNLKKTVKEIRDIYSESKERKLKKISSKRKKIIL